MQFNRATRSSSECRTHCAIVDSEPAYYTFVTAQAPYTWQQCRPRTHGSALNVKPNSWGHTRSLG